jgi:hypothetical protein
MTPKGSEVEISDDAADISATILFLDVAAVPLSSS